MTGHLELQSYLAAVENGKVCKGQCRYKPHWIFKSTSSLINLSETPPSKSDYQVWTFFQENVGAGDLITKVSVS